MLAHCLRQAAGSVLVTNTTEVCLKGAGLLSIPSTRHASSATVQLPLFKYHKLENEPSLIPEESTVTRDEARELYTQMAVIRRIETESSNLYKEKVIRGFCHLYSGQEAVCVGMKRAISPADSVISAYRIHGWAYVMGVTPEGILAELAGRDAGCLKGKGGSMHMYTPNFYGGNGIVGAQVPLGGGIAFAHKYNKDGGVCVTLYGDGAANQGQVFETYNIAKLWNLPCLFVCENNLYGMGTRVERASASTEFYTRGDYVPGICVDGQDVIGVREASKWALEYCRQGKGPLVIEMQTYRYPGHSMSDPGKGYRPEEEIEEWKKRDPLLLFKAQMVNSGLMTEDEVATIDKEVRKQVVAAKEFAKAAPLPDLTDCYTHVQTGPYEVRGADQSINISMPGTYLSSFFEAAFPLQNRTRTVLSNSA